MSKQLTFSAALSVIAMATLAWVSASGGAGLRAWNETDAATGIAAPLISAGVPEFPALN